MFTGNVVRKSALVLVVPCLMLSQAYVGRAGAAVTKYYAADLNTSDGAVLGNYPLSTAARASFVSAPGNVILGNENFDSQPLGDIVTSRVLHLGASGVTGVLTVRSAALAISDAPSAAEGPPEVSGGNYVVGGFPFDASIALELTFSVPIQSIGFYTTFVDGGIRLVEDNGTAVEFDTNPSGVGSTAFMGFVDPDHTFTTLSFAGLLDLDNGQVDHVAFDNITVGLVPEPDTLAVTAIAVPLVARNRRARSV